LQDTKQAPVTTHANFRNDMHVDVGLSLGLPYSHLVHESLKLADTFVRMPLNRIFK